MLVKSVAVSAHAADSMARANGQSPNGCPNPIDLYEVAHSVFCLPCHDAVGNPDRVPLLSYFASLPPLSATTHTRIQGKK